MIVHDVDKSVLFSSGLITQERYEELLEFCKKIVSLKMPIFSWRKNILPYFRQSTKL